MVSGCGVRWLFLVFMVFVAGAACAADCLQFKKIPAVFINTPDWNKTVVQSDKLPDVWHGNVVATMVDNYQITADINKVDGGFCIGIKSIDAIVGYNQFTVYIDIKHQPNSCEYNAILAHEDKHIKTYLEVMNDFKAEMQKALFLAADSVMPIFVPSKNDADRAIDDINADFQANPNLILVKQKINAAQEIRNKALDQIEDGMDLKKCNQNK